MLIGRMHVSDKHSGGFRGVCGGLIYTCTGFDNGWPVVAAGVFRLLGTRSGGVALAAGWFVIVIRPAVRGHVDCGFVCNHDQTRSGSVSGWGWAHHGQMRN